MNRWSLPLKSGSLCPRTSSELIACEAAAMYRFFFVFFCFFFRIQMMIILFLLSLFRMVLPGVVGETWSDDTGRWRLHIVGIMVRGHLWGLKGAWGCFHIVTKRPIHSRTQRADPMTPGQRVHFKKKKLSKCCLTIIESILCYPNLQPRVHTCSLAAKR